MKMKLPEVVTAISIMKGHVVFVAKESAVSVMLKETNKYRNLIIPVPILFPFKPPINNLSQRNNIEGIDIGNK